MNVGVSSPRTKPPTIDSRTIIKRQKCHKNERFQDGRVSPYTQPALIAHYHKQQNTFSLCRAITPRRARRILLSPENNQQSTVSVFGLVKSRCRHRDACVFQFHHKYSYVNARIIRESRLSLLRDSGNIRKDQTALSLFTTSFFFFRCQANNKVTGHAFFFFPRRRINGCGLSWKAFLA